MDTSKCRLLIVDDNPKLCNTIAECFLKDGAFKVHIRNSGAEALAYMRENEPDVALVDMLMPGIDGAELMVQCRENGLASRTKFIALSPLASEEIIKMTEGLGMAYFIAMPTSPEKIFSAVMRLMDVMQGDKPEGEQRITKKKEADMDKRRDNIISNYLHIICIPPQVSGYRFLKVSIEYCVEHYGKAISVTKDVYPAVARICNSTPKRVERNIRTAIERAWIRGDIEMQGKLFGYTVNDKKGRPTNKECIAMLTDRTMMRLKYTAP